MPLPIIINKREINRFLDNYDVGKLISYNRIKLGFANRVIHLKTTKGDYILKIIVRNKPDRVKYEVDLLNFLNKLPTPKPVPTKQGKYLLKYQSTKAFIYKYLPGQHRNGYNITMLKDVGRVLGQLHKQARNFKTKVKRVEFYNLNPTKLKSVVKKCYRIKDTLIISNADYIKRVMPKYFLPQSLPRGAIHIDVKPENVLFSKNKITGLVDFDNSYIGPLVFDLAHTMMWFCTKNGLFNMAKAKVIYQAYVRKRRLSRLEKKYLFEATHFAMLSHVLIDIYYIQKDLTKKYVYSSIRNLLQAQKDWALTKKDFISYFNES